MLFKALTRYLSAAGQGGIAPSINAVRRPHPAVLTKIVPLCSNLSTMVKLGVGGPSAANAKMVVPIILGEIPIPPALSREADFSALF